MLGNFMPTFATYLHPEIFMTSRPLDEIRFMGHSIPYFKRVRDELVKVLPEYETLPLRRADFVQFATVHEQAYLDALQTLARDPSAKVQIEWSLECTGFEHSIPGYEYGLGGMLAAIDAMRAGTLDRAYCDALGGHHAYPARGHGYCMLNVQAAAARYAQAHGFTRVLIVDWDIHHGDGTQTIFAHDPTVYHISIHSVCDLYMMMQRALRISTDVAGRAVGHCNIPLLDKFFDQRFWDELEVEGRYYRAEESIPQFDAALENVPWQPDLICIFSGYDSHGEDCGEGITDWTNADYQHLTRGVLDLAHRAGCPVLSAHGGGYKLEVAVGAALAHIETLATYTT